MPGNDKETIEMLRSDGTLQILTTPLSAAQIVQEFPQHLVCHSHSFYIGHKTPALSPNEKLKVGNKYFLLPQHFFQSPLSLVSLASLISPPRQNAAFVPSARVSAPLRRIQRVSALCQPFQIEKSDVSGGLRMKVSSDFIAKLLEDGRLNLDERGDVVGADSSDDVDRRLCNTPELQREFKLLVKSRGLRWTPKLDSIKEKRKSSTRYS